METWDAITARRNVRTHTAERISSSDLELILEAGRRAPSSRNQQRWDFIVVTERDVLVALTEVWRGAWHVATAAAAVALIAPDIADSRHRESIQYDLGQVTMNMMLAAADRGIGSGHAAVADQPLARRLLGFPDDKFCAWIVTLGYPDDRPLSPMVRPDRRPLEELVHKEQW